jgi:hypothetical protein
MASNSTYDRMTRLLEYMPAEQLLDEVFQALSDTEANSILEHIEDMWDLAEDDEDDDYDDDDIDDADAEDELLYDDEDVEEEVQDQTGNVVNKVLAFRRKEQ